MNQNNALETLSIAEWRGPFMTEMQARAVAALESGKVILLPNLPFRLETDEEKFLNPSTSGDARKNISFDPRTGKIGNASLGGTEATRLAAMMDRFGQSALRFRRDLLPAYAPKLERGRTSSGPTKSKAAFIRRGMTTSGCMSMRSRAARCGASVSCACS